MSQPGGDDEASPSRLHLPSMVSLSDSPSALANLGRVAVVGAGAVGGYYGAKLARGGADVHFLMRRDLEHVRKQGLGVLSEDGDFHLDRVQCQGSTESIGPADLVLIATKATANDALLDLLPPLLKGDTALLTLQNGLGSDEFLAARFGAERVLGGLCFVCLNRVGPGVIRHQGEGRISLGEFAPGEAPASRLKTIAAGFREAGIDCQEVWDLPRERWRKLVWNVPFNGLSIAAGGIDVAQILGDADLRVRVRELMLEVIGAAGKLGHSIPEDLVERQISATRGMGPYKPSSLIDYLEGREVEVDAIWGEPLRRGEGAGAEMGRMRELYGEIRGAVESR